MKNSRFRVADLLFLAWLIVIQALYYSQFWGQIEPRVRALRHLWHS